MPSLHWIGKEQVVNHHHAVPFHILEKKYDFGNPSPLKGENPQPPERGLKTSELVDIEHSIPSSPASGDLGVETPPLGGWGANKIIHGDNLEALKSLLPEYEGKIKCIYIDPPYNTGNENWVYNDNVNHPKIKKWLGEVVGKEGEDLSRHDKWLCMMYPRLKLLHKLLREDGVIFIGIDDNEQANLKLIMDEIFGSSNFITNIIWQKRYTRSNNTDGFTSVVESLICYSKSSLFKPNLLPREDEANARYSNPDNDPRGDWKLIPFTNPLSPKERPNLVYEIINPNTNERIYPTKKAWRTSKETFEEYQKNNLVYWGKDGKSKLPGIKRFINEVKQGVTPINFWNYDYAGHTDIANKEIKDIFEDKIFDTPKPTTLIKRVLEHATNPNTNDIILDSFAGSGTTAHAVLNLNRQDGGNRKFILIEMEDYAETITAERVKRVIGKLSPPNPLVRAMALS